MRRGHFDALRPVCPTCRTAEAAWPLVLAHAWREEGEHVLEGALHCPNPACQREHPVVDGVPILVPDLRAVLTAAPLTFLQRDDLGAPLQSLFGDALGPASAYEQQRQRQSIYVDAHWGPGRGSEGGGSAPEGRGRPSGGGADATASVAGGEDAAATVIARYGADASGTADPAAPSGTVASGTAADLVRRLLALAGPLRGPALELGCGPGRGCLELAGATDGLVLGLELDFAAARFAGRLLREGRAGWSRRRVGLVYEPRTAMLPEGRAAAAARADVWMADALAPPFAAGTFGVVAAMNVLDACPSPWGLLHAFAAALRPGGTGLVASPYDWSPNATAVEQWLGGHSQRGPEGGSAEAAVRACLTPGNPRHVAGLSLRAEAEDLPWRLRVHDRSEVVYRVHGLVLGREAAPPAS